MLILLVEDDPAVRRAVEMALRRRGFDVCMPVSAPFGAGALRLLETEPVDAVILDLLLDGHCLDGFDLARRMRDDARWRRIPVFLMSGLSDEEIHRRAMEYAFAGMTTHSVGKPLDEGLLFEELEALRKT